MRALEGAQQARGRRTSRKFISFHFLRLNYYSFMKKTLDFLEKAKSDVPLSSSSSTELSQFSRQRISININYAYHNPSERKKAAKATKRRTTAEER